MQSGHGANRVQSDLFKFMFLPITNITIKADRCNKNVSLQKQVEDIIHERTNCQTCGQDASACIVFRDMRTPSRKHQQP